MRNLTDRAALGPLEDDTVNSDKDKRPDEVPAEKSDAEDGALKDAGWSKVDLHERTKTPEADTPSDIEPQGRDELQKTPGPMTARECAVSKQGRRQGLAEQAAIRCRNLEISGLKTQFRLKMGWRASYLMRRNFSRVDR